MSNPTGDIALIGLAVMGQNLILNMNDHGFTVVAYNRTTSKVDEFLAGEAKGTQIQGAHSIAELVSKLKTPRRIMMLVKAGQAVDDFIEQLVPHLSAGDIIIDGGNSLYGDTERRVKYCESKGFLFIGTGVSGGEEGARRGPSIMPGGSAKAWPAVKDIFQGVSAKVDGGVPCCDWVGDGGSGHYVKMVHNGIEYGMMQSYAEGFEILAKSRYQLDLAKVSDLWMQGSVVRSWLLELAARAFRAEGSDLKGIKGWVADSGEGRWTVQEAIDLDVPAPLITLSLLTRFRSRQDDSYSAKVLAALRNQFGGHSVKSE